MNKELITFKWSKIRRIRDDNKELRYFSVVDVVSALSWSDGKDVWAYWRKLKQRLKQDWSEVVTKCHGLKLVASDGKMRLTDVANTQTMFRIIQSIPSPNAEPFKLRLAKVWYERIEETQDPELWINRALQNYINKWYDESWINQRLKTIEVRKALTDERKKRWILDNQYGILTDEITKAWAGISTLEVILNMLAEAATTEISKKKQPKWLKQNQKIAKKWGKAALAARENIESEVGESLISK